VTTRPLHAVLLPPNQAARWLLGALPGALDGTGPAVLPLDPSLPKGRLDALIAALAPSVIHTEDGTEQLIKDDTKRTEDDTKRLSPATLASPPAPGVAQDVAVVIATSGSTGRPKGAELTGAALLASARASLDRIGATPGQRWLCCLPVFHVAGLGVLIRSLLAGTEPAVVPAGELNAAALAAAGCEYVSLVPAQLRRLLDADAPLDGPKAILLGGAAAPAGLLDRARAAGARVITTYGMTETCGGCVYDGIPLAGVSADIGADDRIRITGPVLFSGYRLRPDLTAAALDGDAFVTSDLGFIDTDGRLAVRGRADGMINTGGEMVVTAEVEEALLGCPSVRDAVVVGVPDPKWGERVAAVVVPADPARPPELTDLRSQLRGKLPRYAAPQTLILVAAIPLLPSGKPDRTAIAELGGG
jgi:O-succinylbenzoic acid--CoA ligase